jgi:protein SCO1/2
MIQRYLIAAIFIAIIALGATVFLWQPQSPLSDVPRGGDFTLDSIDGPVSLSDFKGKVVVLYFGYTFCPDICPTSLALLSNALQQLTPEQQRQVQPIFVTVDPERDGLEHLRDYGRYFYKSLIGLSGSPEAIKKAADLYGASYRRVESDSAAGYLVDHSAYLYLIDQHGKLVGQIAHGTPSKQIRDALIKLINPSH